MAWNTFCKDVATVPPLPFPSLPLDVGPLIVGRGLGAIYLPQRVRAEPGRQTVLVNFRLNISHGSNDLQELFTK